MDGFMDKLADRLHAEDMIRANTAAEVEELGRVKGQIEALQGAIEHAKDMIGQLQETVARAENAANQAQSASERAENAANQAQFVTERVEHAAKEALSVTESAENIANRAWSASESAEHAANQLSAVSERMESAADRLLDMQAQCVKKEEAPATVASENDQTKPELDADILYIIEEEVSSLGKSLENLERPTADADYQAEFSGIKTQLDGIQNGFDAVTAKISVLYDQIAGMQSEKTGEDCVNSFRGDLAKVQAGIDALSESIQTKAASEEEGGMYDDDFFEVKTEISELNNNVSDLEGLMVDTNEQIVKLEETIRVAQESHKEEPIDFSPLNDSIQSSIQSSVQTVRDDFGLIGEKLDRLKEQVASRDGELSGQGELLMELKTELSRMDEHLTNVGASNNSKQEENAQALRRFFGERFDRLQSERENKDESSKDIEELKALLEEFRSLLDEKETKTEEHLKGMHEGLREGYHKECVKVYRNVQAAFTEENQRQTVSIEEIVGKQSKSSKLAVVFAILAFCMGLASVVLQVLSLFKII